MGKSIQFELRAIDKVEVDEKVQNRLASFPMEIERLVGWFMKEKRAFPWRGEVTPYAVWVSEVMLQQTQASVVVGYFERWMHHFPNVEALASAPEASVMKVWEGLGYYSRARNLQKGARALMRDHGGELPNTREELMRIPGIGAYTAGAILSFAFGKRAAAVDGNVLRVMARHEAIEEEIDSLSVQKKVAERVEQLLPDREPWVAMEALIELGATLCGRRPICEECPLQRQCQAHLQKRAEELPRKRKRASVVLLRREVAIVFYREQLLLRKAPPGEVMAGLYEFPYWEEEIRLGDLGIKAHRVRDLTSQQQTFTRYRAQLSPSLWEAEALLEVPGYRWVATQEVSRYPFSSGHRRILAELLTLGGG